MKRSLTVALLSALLPFGWQWLTVHYNYGGDWTALFDNGSIPRPPLDEFRATYIFPATNGYDGQFYRYIAHDPFFTRGLSNWVDAPRLRYRRVLLPFLAHAGALGKPSVTDASYFAVTLAFVFLGSYWVSRYAAARGRHAAWGLGFLLVPAVLVSVDRMTVDVALAALCAGWALHCAGKANPSKPGWVLLAAIPLARETGLLLNLATGIGLGRARKLRGMAVWGAAMLPCAAWYAFVAAHTEPDRGPAFFTFAPLLGWFERLRHPVEYGPAVPFRAAVVALDCVALAGIALAVAMAIFLWMKRRNGATEVAMVLFAVMVVATRHAEVWADAFAFGRVFSPLLLLLALKALDTGKAVLALPLALVAMRVIAQFGNEALGILKGCCGS